MSPACSFCLDMRAAGHSQGREPVISVSFTPFGKPGRAFKTEHGAYTRRESYMCIQPDGGGRSLLESSSKFDVLSKRCPRAWE